MRLGTCLSSLSESRATTSPQTQSLPARAHPAQPARGALDRKVRGFLLPEITSQVLAHFAGSSFAVSFRTGPLTTCREEICSWLANWLPGSGTSPVIRVATAMSNRSVSFQAGWISSRPSAIQRQTLLGVGPSTPSPCEREIGVLDIAVKGDIKSAGPMLLWQALWIRAAGTS